MPLRVTTSYVDVIRAGHNPTLRVTTTYLDVIRAGYIPALQWAYSYIETLSPRVTTPPQDLTLNLSSSFSQTSTFSAIRERLLTLFSPFEIEDIFRAQRPISLTFADLFEPSSLLKLSKGSLIITSGRDVITLPQPSIVHYENLNRARDYSNVIRITLTLALNEVQRRELQIYLKHHRSLPLTLNDWTGDIWLARLTDYIGNKAAMYEFYLPGSLSVTLQFDAIKIGS